RVISERVHLTPVIGSETVARRTGAATFHLKCESLQKTGSFKVRGALNAIAQLDVTARERGVVTFSAGNHAQAVAWAASAAGVRSTVVMPETASASKAAASAGYGATVIRHGDGAAAFDRAMAIAVDQGAAFVHPFDQLPIMAGTATVGLEILDQAPGTDVIVVPVGGGGLLAGIAAAVRRLAPNIRIFGVEPEGAAAMRRSLDAGHPVRLDRVDTIADGLAAPFAGNLTFPVIRDLVDDVVLVRDDEIAAAVALLSRTKLLAEPAGAAATAAVIAGRIPDLAGRHVLAVLSGGNVDLDRLAGLIVGPGVTGS
ncbi:MAG: pyridoxal-phosphate dependent enzyme, partial [Gemmatimonadales bacterium]